VQQIHLAVDSLWNFDLEVYSKSVARLSFAIEALRMVSVKV